MCVHVSGCSFIHCRTTVYTYHIARKFCDDFKFGDVAYHDNIANLNSFKFLCGNVTFLLYVFMYVCDHPSMDCVPFLSVAALIPAAAPPVCGLTSGQTLTPAEGPGSTHTHTSCTVNHVSS